MQAQLGLGWRADGTGGGYIQKKNTCPPTGVHNVLKILESLEDDSIDGLEYLDLYTCTRGCVGGTECRESLYRTRRLKVVRAHLPKRIRKMSCRSREISPGTSIRFDDVYKLGNTMQESLRRLAAAEKIEKNSRPRLRILRSSDLPGPCGRYRKRQRPTAMTAFIFLHDHIHALTMELNTISDDINRTILEAKGHPTAQQMASWWIISRDEGAELNELDTAVLNKIRGKI